MDEELLLKQMPECTRHHLFFRRATLPATFDNKPHRFDNKYPPGPTDGWLTQTDKMYDGQSANYLREMKEASLATVETVGESGLWEYIPPDPRSYYVILVDPANFGSLGDYSGISIFDVHTWEEVAALDDRMQPTKAHRIIAKAAQRYRQIGPNNGNSVIIESNAAALLGIALNENTYNVWFQTHKSGRTEPGWRATAKSLQEAEAAMDQALENQDIKLNSPTGLRQLINFDGKNRDRRMKRGGNTSHFDLARTYIMAAWALTNLNWPRRLTDEQYQDRLASEERRMTTLHDDRQREQMRVLNANLRKRRGRHNMVDNNKWAPGAGWLS